MITTSHYQPTMSHGSTWKFTTPTGSTDDIATLADALRLAEKTYLQDREEAANGKGVLADVLRKYFFPVMPEPKPLKNAIRHILDLMHGRGGFFVQRLATATAAADPDNQQKIVKAFDTLFAKYDELLSGMPPKDFPAAPGMSGRVKTQTMVDSPTGQKWNAAGNHQSKRCDDARACRDN
jgi:hypothetical protein